MQLTGRANYTKYENAYGWPLVEHPDFANDPWVASVLLAKYLKNHESRIRTALRNNDFKVARSAVNGGTNGLDHFIDAYSKGQEFLRQEMAKAAMRRANQMGRQN